MPAPTKTERTTIEVQHSDDGVNWYRSASYSHPDTVEGMKAARQEIQRNRSGAFLRISRRTVITEVIEGPVRRKDVMTKEQVNDLLARGRKALQGIRGVSVHEGTFLSFDPSSQFPVHVSVLFSPVAVLGKRPSRSQDETGWKAWKDAEQARVEKTRALIQDALREAGIRYKATNREIYLLP